METRTHRRCLDLAEQRAQKPASYVAVNRGDAPRVISEAASRLEATYESPFQAHATMEPMNTTVDVRGGAVEVWSPTQFADEIQREIATLSGLPQNKITVHTTFSGGSFGRRYQWDYRSGSLASSEGDVAAGATVVDA